MSNDNTYIQISKTSSTEEEDAMQVEILREGEKENDHIRLELSLLDYARVLTGEAHVPCKVIRWVKKNK